MDMKVESFLLVSTLDIVIGQRLVRRLTETKEKYLMTKAEIATLAKSVDLDRVLVALKAEKIVKPTDTWDKITFYRPAGGLPADRHGKEDEGYKGRIGIHEVLAISPAIREIMLKSSTSDALEAQAKKEGMLTMLEDGLYKAARGITSIEEVLRTVSE